jgi:hypothetical protein
MAEVKNPDELLALEIKIKSTRTELTTKKNDYEQKHGHAFNDEKSTSG